MQAADITNLVPALVGTVDLALSWQVFEHVKALDVAFANVQRNLRADGALVSLFSGKWSAFAILNQVVPILSGTVSLTVRRNDAPTIFRYFARITIAAQLGKCGR